MVRVGQQREVQLVLRAEVAVRLLAVGAYADDAEAPLGQLLPAVAQALGFERAPRGVVLRVEVEDRTLPLEVGQRQALAVLCYGAEVGWRISGLEVCHRFVT